MLRVKLSNKCLFILKKFKQQITKASFEVFRKRTLDSLVYTYSWTVYDLKKARCMYSSSLPLNLNLNLELDENCSDRSGILTQLDYTIFLLLFLFCSYLGGPLKVLWTGLTALYWLSVSNVKYYKGAVTTWREMIWRLGWLRANN